LAAIQGGISEQLRPEPVDGKGQGPCDEGNDPRVERDRIIRRRGPGAVELGVSGPGGRRVGADYEITAYEPVCPPLFQVSIRTRARSDATVGVCSRP